MFWMAMGIGILLGLRHALDADHVVAVSTMALEERNLLRGGWIGFCWGVGHALVLFLFGGALILSGIRLPEVVGRWLEGGVGVMLILIALGSWRRMRRSKLHIHVHQHDGERYHTHFHVHDDSPGHLEKHHGWKGSHSFLIGTVHGLAGTGAVMVLTIAAVSDPLQRIAYLASFGLGTILSMTLFSLSLTLITKLLNRQSFRFSHILPMGAAGLSAVIGVMIIVESLMG